MKAGDLSGKHGKLFGPIVRFSYIEGFLSFNSSSPETIVGRSIVIQKSDGTRIACSKYPLSNMILMIALPLFLIIILQA